MKENDNRNKTRLKQLTDFYEKQIEENEKNYSDR